MGTPELLALSLGLSLLTAASTYMLVRLLEMATPDPVLREKAWAVALSMPVVPIALVTFALLLPAPMATQAVGLDRAGTGAAIVDVVLHQAVPVPLADERIAIGVLGLAGLVAVLRLTGLARRTVRLRRLLRTSGPVSPAVRQVVEAAALRLDAPMPDVRTWAEGGGALVAGLRRPVLLLPESQIMAADARTLSAVCAHELAHLRRGDHRTLWVEEALLTVMAFNPLMALIRDHRAAAREEACDVLALAQTSQDGRRLYARALLDALRAPRTGQDVPALTFTSSRRIRVMNRFKAILSPAQRSDTRQQLTALGLGIAVTAVTGSGSLALAGQRAALTPPAPAPAVAEPAPLRKTAAVVPSVPPATVVAPVAPRPEPEPASAPEPKPEPVAARVVEPTVILNPGWDRPPTPSYPEAALQQGLSSGAADLSCAVRGGGRVAACRVVSESPPGAGFGAAALQAAGTARLTTAAGAAEGGTVRFTVRFKMSPS